MEFLFDVELVLFEVRVMKNVKVKFGSTGKVV